MRVVGATSQLDLPSLTPLSVAGLGRLQLGVPQWVTCYRKRNAIKKCGDTHASAVSSTIPLSIALEKVAVLVQVWCPQ